MSAYEIGNLAVGAATFAVLLLTLRAVKRYTIAANRTADAAANQTALSRQIAEAANEQAAQSRRMAEAAITQAEATHRPCVVLQTVPDRSFDADLEESVAARLPGLRVGFEN